MSEEQKNIEAVAALLGATRGAINNLNEHIVDDGTAQKLQQDLNAEAILQDSIVKITGGKPIGGAPPQPSQPAPAPPATPAPPAAPVNPVPPSGDQQHVQHLQQNMQMDYLRLFETVMEELQQMNTKIDDLTQKVNTLVSLDERLVKSVDRGLINKTKQITIKLNDTKD